MHSYRLPRFIFLGVAFVTSTVQATNALHFPKEKSGQAWVAPEQSVNALLRNGNEIFLLAQKKNILVKHPFDSSLPPLKRFKNTTDTQRWDLPKDINLTAWRGIEKYRDTLILLEGVHLSFGIWSLKDNKELHRFTIPRDLIKSTGDAIGEPTHAEIARNRTRFSQEFDQAKEKPKFVGIKLIPDSIKHQDRVEFLVTTKLPSFALIKIGCTDDADLGSCRIQRVCDLPLTADKKGRAINGLAYSAKRNLFLIAQNDDKLLYGFEYKTCAHIRLVKTIHLPKELKSISQIHVDQDDRLWVTSFDPDDRQDSSVVYFEAW